MVLLGGLLENRRLFVMLEGSRLAAVATVVLTTGGWFSLRDAEARTAILAAVALSLAWLVGAGRSGEHAGDGRLGVSV
jgi:hypothetical protein